MSYRPNEAEDYTLQAGDLHPRPLESAVRILLVVLVSLVLGGCGGAASPADDGKLKIVVTLPPLAWVADEFAGEDAEITVLIPAGASPHGFEPSPSDMAALRQADLILMVGDIDAWVLSGVGKDDDRVVWMQDPNSPAQRRFLGGKHPWLVPDSYSSFSSEASLELLWLIDGRVTGDSVIESALEDVELSRGVYEAKEALSDSIDGNGVLVVTGHAAWSEFFASIGIEDVLAVGGGHGMEPSASALASVEERARGASRVLVVIEPREHSEWLRSFAERVGGAVVELDPVGTRDWVGDMIKRYEAVEAALESLE